LNVSSRPPANYGRILEILVHFLKTAKNAAFSGMGRLGIPTKRTPDAAFGLASALKTY
jgi:hypothetical protein